MKKLFAAMILLCLTCTGCFQGGSNLIITDDGKVFMRNKFIGVPMIAAQIESFKDSHANKPNAEISPVAENNMSGYEIRVNYPSIEAFAADDNDLFAAHKGKCNGIQHRRNWFFDAYKFDLLLSGERTLSPSEAAAVQSMLSQATFNLAMELPYSADEHNADKFDAANKFLTWNLAATMTGGGEKHMRVQFKLWRRENIAITAAVALLLLAGGIFFHVKSRAEESEQLSAGMIFKRNIFAGLFIALAAVSAYMLLSPLNFTGADIISAVKP